MKPCFKLSQVRVHPDASQAEFEDLEKLCQDLNAYEKEFSNIINDEKEDFNRKLST